MLPILQPARLRGQGIAPAGSLLVSVDLTLTSTLGGAGLPFAYGMWFGEGDIASGDLPTTSDLTTYQWNTFCTWEDGSIKHGMISGTGTFTAGVGKAVTLVPGAGPGSGTALDLDDLAATSLAMVFDAGAFGSATISGGDLASPFMEWHTGPVCSSWVYRKQIGSDAHLVAWAWVKLFASGNVEVFPWIENGYFKVSSPTNKSDTYTFTISTERYNQAVDIKHHTRLPLVTGTTFSYWTGTDPQITPAHDGAYARSTKLVPNYADQTPTSALLTATGSGQVLATYTPAWIGQGSTAMGNVGYQERIGILPLQSAAYITSNGHIATYNAVISNGLGSGGWSIHYRDENTNLPIAYSDFPTDSLQFPESTGIPSASGGTNGTEDNAHQPALAFLPYLITGNPFFFEEMLFWVTWNYLDENYAYRENVSGIIRSDHSFAARGAAWCSRTLAQACAVWPSQYNSDLLGELVSSWENTIDFYHASCVTGTRFSGLHVNNLGVIPPYSAINSSPYGDVGGLNLWWEAGFMQAFFVQCMGYTYDIEVPQSASSLAKQVAVRDHCYKFPVGLSGDGAGWCYRRFGVYDICVGAPTNTYLTSYLPDFATVYANYNTAKSLSTLDCSAGGTIKSHSTDTDANASWWATSYGGNLLPALSYAVDHSASGANDGYTRVSGASNFTLGNCADAPQFGIVPR